MKIKFFTAFLALLLLFGCSRSTKMDINVFFDGFNKASEFTDFSPVNAVFDTENKTRTYYCRIDDKILISLSSLEDGTLYRCAVSFEHTGNFDLFKDAVCSSISSFCNEKTEVCASIFNELKITKGNLADGFSSKKHTDWYTFNCESSNNVTVFIIRAIKYCPETNTSPTLKAH